MYSVAEIVVSQCIVVKLRDRGLVFAEKRMSVYGKGD
jgi:hypothetical protein